MPTGESYYEVMTYWGMSIPLSSPLHLSLCAQWNLGSASGSNLDNYHLAELGCGDGANLLALAFYDPSSFFLGIDNSNNQLESARKGAECLGLKNIQFLQQDIRDINPADFQLFDYIIAHGLYSWVPDDARHAILDFCRQSLAPNGLAYISYNAQPGWSTRRLVREALLRSRSVREAALEDKAARAIQVITQLLKDLPYPDYASSVLLAKELERVRDGKPFYVLHEYLAEVNDGFWLGDFVERAREHGLDYVTDAQFCRWEGYVPKELQAALAKRNLDPIEQEETADLLCDRYFRASILCREDAPRILTSHEDLLEQVHIATSLHAQADPFNLIDGVAEWFLGTGGTRITLEASITKAAMLQLSAQWPLDMSLGMLFAKASEFLAAQGCPIPADARVRLANDLITLFEAGQVDLRLRTLVYPTEVPEHPKAHALARFEAEHREALTTPYHIALPFDPLALTFVRELDGSRSISELEFSFGKEMVSQTLAVMGRWGLLECRLGSLL